MRVSSDRVLTNGTFYILIHDSHACDRAWGPPQREISAFLPPISSLETSKVTLPRISQEIDIQEVAVTRDTRRPPRMAAANY